MISRFLLASAFAVTLISTAASEDQTTTQAGVAVVKEGGLLFDLPVPCDVKKDWPEIEKRARARADKWARDHHKTLEADFAILALPQSEGRETCQSEGGKAMVVIYYKDTKTK
ncbi:hypothetical protein HYT05_01725 [Candidatus Kaiserbacteria bacterium]|nr:hypothetical protein [Candidatus Kaiserbacteria bacterium]